MKRFKIVTALLFVIIALQACEDKGYDKNHARNEPEQTNTDTVKTANPADARFVAGQRLFDENCSSCHTFHRNLVGPALAGVTQRRDMDWLVKFTRNASAMIEKGDPIAKKLYTEYKPALMTSFEFITDQQIKDIYYYIENEKSVEEDVLPLNEPVTVPQ